MVAITGISVAKVSRQRGAALLMLAVILAAVMMTFSTIYLYLSLNDKHNAEGTMTANQSHYVADAGLQLSLAALRADNLATTWLTLPNFPDLSAVAVGEALPSPYAAGYTATLTAGNEPIAKGTQYFVKVLKVTGNDYQWTNTTVNPQQDERHMLLHVICKATYQGVANQVEAYIRRVGVLSPPATFSMPGAFTLMIKPTATRSPADSPLPNLSISGSQPVVDGKDHDPVTGAVTASQVDATDTIAMNGNASLPGYNAALNNSGFLVNAVGHVKVNNNASNLCPVIETIVDNVKNNHDSVMTAGTYSQTNAALYGDANNYKVVYASNANGQIHLSGTFKGYGILVIEQTAGSNLVLRTSGESCWHGLVIYASANSSPPTEILSGGGRDDAHVIGGLVNYFSADTLNFTNLLVSLRGHTPNLLYSSVAVSSALQVISQVRSEVSSTYTMMEYNVPLQDINQITN